MAWVLDIDCLCPFSQIKDFNPYDIDGSGEMIRSLINYRAAQSVRMNLANIIPPIMSSYFTYDGSMTKPPCTQNVHWIISTTTKPVSRAEVWTVSLIFSPNLGLLLSLILTLNVFILQLETLRHLTSKSGTQIAGNWRQLQKFDAIVNFVQVSWFPFNW